jgi:putative flippase GtrA
VLSAPNAWGFLRFALVGGVSLAADAGSLFLFHGVLHIWLALATAMAYGVAFVVNFGLNRAWVFKTNGSMAAQLRRYVALVMANLAVTVLAVQGLVLATMPYMEAKLAVAVVLAIVNFFVSRRWIFL